MAVREENGLKVWQRRERAKQFTIWAGYLFVTAIFVACWQLMSEKTVWFFVLDAPRQAADMASRFRVRARSLARTRPTPGTTKSNATPTTSNVISTTLTIL